MSDGRTKEEISLEVETLKLIKEATQYEKDYWDWKREQAKAEAQLAQFQLEKARSHSDMVLET